MADKDAPSERPATDPTRGKDGKFGPGNTAATGGVPKWRKEIEKMLNDEHRTPQQMSETFALIRKVAHGVDEPVYYKGEVCGEIRKYDGAWMNLYLERVLGPVRDLDVDLTDAPEPVLRWWAENGPGSN